MMDCDRIREYRRLLEQDPALFMTYVDILRNGLVKKTTMVYLDERPQEFKEFQNRIRSILSKRNDLSWLEPFTVEKNRPSDFEKEIDTLLADPDDLYKKITHFMDTFLGMECERRNVSEGM